MVYIGDAVGNNTKIKTTKMHSNLFNEIQANNRRETASKIAFWSVVILSAISAVAAASWWRSADAMAGTTYARDVHICLGSVREINQRRFMDLIDPGQCISNPHYVE